MLQAGCSAAQAVYVVGHPQLQAGNKACLATRSPPSGDPPSSNKTKAGPPEL